MFKEIKKCRVCGNSNLVEILDLGNQFLTGIFPKKRDGVKNQYPLKLVKCHGKQNSKCCNLVQLKHNQDYEKMFSSNYGYKSSLNDSMITHLKSKITNILKNYKLESGDIVIDIGSNDATSLSFYSKKFKRIGFDPIGEKFKNKYKDMLLIPNFFNFENYNKVEKKKAKIITSFSMFYDVEDPIHFCNDISKVIDKKEGIWILEQSYMPTMLDKTSYDTICHEHLTYYSLTQIDWIVKKCNLRIIDFETNKVNGGSFSITVCHQENKKYEVKNIIKKILNKEKKYKDMTIFKKFAKNVLNQKIKLKNILTELKTKNFSISALGASTKGNVILQYCDLDSSIINYVGEVNKDKFSCYTPGTYIPIISETDLLKKNPDYIMILPWHFKDFFLSSSKFKNRNLIFPLPKIEIIRT